MQNELDVEWLQSASKDSLNKILLEYKIVIRSFTSWLSLIMANTRNDKVKQLLIPNLIEECGEFEKNNSHFQIYTEMVKSFGVSSENHRPLKISLETEKWFTDKFCTENTYEHLCVFGPAFEKVTCKFIGPMYKATKKNYGEQGYNYDYFTLHLSEMEDEHEANIEKAMAIMEDENPVIKNKKDGYVEAGIATHQKFWNEMKQLYHI